MQIGTPKAIYYQPRSAFVADFIGTMNRVRLNGSEALFRPEDTRIVSAGEAQFSGAIASVCDRHGVPWTFVNEVFAAGDAVAEGVGDGLESVAAFFGLSSV